MVAYTFYTHRKRNTFDWFSWNQNKTEKEINIVGKTLARIFMNDKIITMLDNTNSV